MLALAVGRGHGARDRRAAPRPWRARPCGSAGRGAAVGGTIVLALSGWFFVRNQRLYGQAAPTGYEGLMKPNQAPYEKIPYLQRRPGSFY